MKVIIQIPSYNEESTLPLTVGCLPKELPGVDVIEYLVVNDGSKDRTSQVARELGVHYVINLPVNKGLANAFKTGLEEALLRGADIIVNTDADNQYNARDIEKLIQPIIHREADIVVGERPISEIKHFSFIKKKLQRFGSWVVGTLSGTKIPDAPSGFRAFSKEAAIRLNVISSYTYTLETLIQAGHSNIKVTSVPIRVNNKTRESRLMKNMFSYIYNSLKTTIRIRVSSK